MIGVESPEKELVAHNGVFCGSSSAFYTFPDTQSAIITFANGLQGADAAEYAAQIISQALLDLHPKVDILALARRKMDLEKRHFMDSLSSHREKKQDNAILEIPREDFVGDFEAPEICLSIFQESKTAELSLRFNGNHHSTMPLQYYQKDTYSFFPTSRAEWLLKSMFEWSNHTLALLEFKRDSSGGVIGLFWQWDHEGSPSWFQKRT